MSNLVLSYNGIDVRNSNDGEMLNLTDMWKACGSDPSKRPAKWMETDAAKDFVEYVRENIGIRRTDTDIIRKESGGKGGGGGT